MSRRFLFKKVFIGRIRDEYYVGHRRNPTHQEVYQPVMSGAKGESDSEKRDNKIKAEQKK